MAKKFFDNSESKMLANMEILPLSHFLYMCLRLSFDESPDCGLFKVTVREMISITGCDRSVITEVLLPELMRNNLIMYDNGVVFVPGTPETEGFEKKLHSNNPHHKAAFLKALRSCETVVSAISGRGGVNLATLNFLEYWSRSIDLLMSDILVTEQELLELEAIEAGTSPNADRSKRIFLLKKSISEFYACRSIVERKNSYSPSHTTTHAQPIGENLPTHVQPIHNPSTTHAQPIGENLPTHPQPIHNPSTTHPQPIGENLPIHAQPMPNPSTTHYGYGNGIGDKGKNKEVSFLYSGGEGDSAKKENFSSSGGLASIIPKNGLGEVAAEYGKKNPRTPHDDVEAAKELSSYDLDFSNNWNGVDNEKIISDNELGAYELVSDNSLEAGIENDDSSFFNPDSG